jgi:hypothetical protein
MALQRTTPKPAKKTKYRNVKIVDGGQKFDSQAEHRRYRRLLLLQKAGRIQDLTRQVTFVLAPKVLINGVAKRSLIYRADFGYFDVATGKQIVEDVKGTLTAVYKLKRHLMKSIYGIDILETK